MGASGRTSPPAATFVFFDTTTFSWLPTPLAGLQGNPPPARSYAALVYLPQPYLNVNPPANQILIFGGETSIGQYNDLFLLNFPVCPPLNLGGVASTSCGTGG